MRPDPPPILELALLALGVAAILAGVLVVTSTAGVWACCAIALAVIGLALLLQNGRL